MGDQFHGAILRGFAALLAGCAMAAAGARAQTAAEVQQLLDEGRAEQAYELGRKAPGRLGEPAFDLAFGIAAINAGHAAQGVLALERFLINEPGHEAARVELARGYYLLGDDVRAKEEFEAALARKPPRAAARVIEEYLDAIAARAAKYRPTAMAYFEFGGGYDTNPRAGVDDPVVALPTLGEVTVVDTGLRQADATAQYGAGFRLTGPLSAHSAAFAAGQAEVIRYQDESAFDQEIYAGSLGAMGQWGRHGWRAGASASYQKLYRKPYRRTHGAFADGRFEVDDRHAISLGLQAGKFIYQDAANAVRNSDFRTAALGLRRSFAGDWRPALDLSANGGREKNVHDDRQDLSRDLYGGRVGITVSPRAGLALGASALLQYSDYLEPDPILFATREDRYAAADLNLAWDATRELTLRVEYTNAKNDSNIALYEYRRQLGLVRLRYEFR